ncbi:MAG TPA: hypothetical protein VIR56_01955 [Solimonas sp.]
MKLAALLFAVLFVGVIVGFAMALFTIGAGDVPARRIGKAHKRRMAVDLATHKNVQPIRRVLCDETLPEQPNDYLALLRARGAL